MRIPALLAALALSAAPALAQTFNFTISRTGSPVSSMSSTFTGSATFSGTLIGNYNQTTNPGGTRTLNYSIVGTRPPAPTNISKTLSGNGNANGNAAGLPTGTYTLSVNNASVTISNLTADLIGSATQPNTPVNANVTYQSFLTAAPNNSYPFLVPVPVALGNASVTAMMVAQTATATGPITSGSNGTFNFTMQVPADITTTVDFQGAPITQTTSQTLTVTGTVQPTLTPARASLSLSITQSNTSNTPQPQPPNQPFDLPPLSGSGEAAHLLLSLSVDSQNTSVMTTATLPATGVPPAPTCGTADFDGDGDVGTDQDIEAFFSCLAGNCCTRCYRGGADFNGDGDVGTDADIESFFRVLAGGHC